MDSAMLSHDPDSGVYSGITPWANSHNTSASLQCPARLSSTSSSRNGGNASGSVIGDANPSCQRCLPGRSISRCPVRCRQGGQDRGELRLQPRVQHRVRARGDALNPHLAAGRVEQRQELGRSLPQTLVRLLGRLAFGLPTRPRIRLGLERPRFIFAPDRQAQRLADAVRVFDQFFLAAASGSVTITVPVLRRRRACPVGHHVRLRCQLHPAALSTVWIV